MAADEDISKNLIGCIKREYEHERDNERTPTSLSIKGQWYLVRARNDGAPMLKVRDCDHLYQRLQMQKPELEAQLDGKLTGRSAI